MLSLSPRAVARLETYQPAWPLPKIFRMTRAGKLDEGLFRGQTINTPSLLCVEDALDSLRWAEEIGGREALIRRSEVNLEAVAAWVAGASWVDFLAREPQTRSSTSICLRVVDPWFTELSAGDRAARAKAIVASLEQESVAFDIGAYRDAPPGLRLWGGATVETADLEALFPWLDWAFAQIKNG